MIDQSTGLVYKSESQWLEWTRGQAAQHQGWLGGFLPKQKPQKFYFYYNIKSQIYEQRNKRAN